MASDNVIYPVNTRVKTEKVFYIGPTKIVSGSFGRLEEEAGIGDYALVRFDGIGLINLELGEDANPN